MTGTEADPRLLPGSIDLEVVVNSISEGLYIVDTARRIMFWSRGAERITGWKAAEVVGSLCEDGILEHIDSGGHKLCHTDFCPLARSIRTGESQRIASIVYSLGSGSRRVPVEVTTAPLRDRAGSIVGGVEVFRDISAAVADLHTARLIQRDAMETRLPLDGRISFQVVSHPRDIVGGDFYRIEKTGDARFSFLLADVTSHGVSAALYTLRLRTLWDEGRDLLGSPAEFAARLNSRLAASGGDVGYFASGLFGVFDCGSPAFTFSSMGSPPFFTRRADGDVEAHAPPGLLLGIEEGIAFPQGEIRLSPGSALLFFTDGAFEVENRRGELYGIERLRERFARFDPSSQLEDFCAGVEGDLLEHSGRLQLPDDFTAVLVRIA